MLVAAVFRSVQWPRFRLYTGSVTIFSTSMQDPFANLCVGDEVFGPAMLPVY